MFGKKSAVGLDIGSSSCKVVELQTSKKATLLLNYGITYLLPDAIVDGEVMDREVVIETLRGLFESRGITTKDVVTSLPGKGVIVKRITVGKMKESEARLQIRWEAEQHIPFDISDVNLDFEIVNPNAGEDQMEVILVAAKKDVVNSYVGLVREAGLNPVVVDVGAFSIQNTFDVNYDTSPEELIALLDIGVEKTSINFVSGGTSYFSRDIPVATALCLQRLQKDVGLSFEKALEALKGEAGGEVDETKLKGLIRDFAEELCVGIERTLPYLPSNMEKMDRMYVSGGGANIRDMPQLINERLGVPVERMNPLQRIEYDPAVFGDEDPQVIGPILAQAIGLGLRGG
jgi:type IV pilus assembly protein PilM